MPSFNFFNNRDWAESPSDRAGGGLRDWWGDFRDTLGYFTILPLYGPEAAARGGPNFSVAVRAVPLAGLALGAVVALVLVLSHAVGLTNFVAATLAAAVGAVLTGAMHELGLARTADALAVGKDTQSRLKIIHEAHVSAFGVVAIALTFLMRIGAHAGIIERSGMLTIIFIVLTAEAISRAGTVWSASRLRPAAKDVEGIAAARPHPWAVRQCLILATLIAFIFSAAMIGVLATAFALATAALAVMGMTALARAAFGGETGAVAVATQQIGLTAFILAALAALPV